MKMSRKLCTAAGFFGLPLAMLLWSCGEPIPEYDDVLTPVNQLFTTVTTTTEATTTTTTVTLSPQWQENAAGNYNGAGGVVIRNVPHYTQFTSYFTACESISATAVLQYYGVNMTLDRFIDDYLPKANYPDLGTSGELEGASPWEYFIGDPRDGGGFGCYNTCIASAINKIADGLAIPLDGYSIEDLCTQYIDKGQPVIFWATIGMQQPYVSEFHWYLPDGKMYYFVNPEHACVLIGYDDNYYYFSDSESYMEVAGYPKWQVQAAYEGLFKQAVVIDPLILETLPAQWRSNSASGNEAIQ